MREKILKMLSYPRALVRDQLELRDCPHNGNFAGDDGDCQECGRRLECSWLYDNEEFVALGRRPVTNLLESLDFARTYVDFRVDQMGHNRRICRCEACRWLRTATRLLKAG
jgi:hypothetical protein